MRLQEAPVGLFYARHLYASESGSLARSFVLVDVVMPAGKLVRYSEGHGAKDFRECFHCAAIAASNAELFRTKDLLTQACTRKAS